MNELSIPLHRLLAVTFWSATAILVLTGWIAYIAHRPDLGIMLLTMACPTALGAVAATARAWVVCLLRTVRTQGGGFVVGSDLRSVPGD